MHALHNTALEITLSTLEKSHTADIRELAEIFDKATPGARPPRVVPPEIKRQNQLLIEQNTNITKIPDHAKPLKVTIVEAYPEDIQQAKPVFKTTPRIVSTDAPSRNTNNENETRPNQKKPTKEATCDTSR